MLQKEEGASVYEQLEEDLKNERLKWYFCINISHSTPALPAHKDTQTDRATLSNVRRQMATNQLLQVSDHRGGTEGGLTDGLTNCM